MLTNKAQIVIGIGVIILSAAFLLVGVYFANLQGLFFKMARGLCNYLPIT
jgi:hypothetical protein